MTHSYDAQAPAAAAGDLPVLRPLLRVLVVDDSDDDSALIERALRRGGYQVDAERVDTAEAMRAALDGRAWDVIIADYSLPRFRGLEALALLHEIGLDIPFIMVSGRVGEDVAVEAMKAGAHDFVSKDNLARLAPAVERELQEAQVRRARCQAEEERARLYEAEQQARAGVEALASDLAAERGLLDTLLRQAPVGFAFLDRDLRFVRVNDRLAETIGLPSSTYLDRTVQEVVADLGAPGEAFHCLADIGEQRLQRVLETGEPLLDVPTTCMTPAAPGEVRHLRLNHYPVRGADGAIVGMGIVSVETTAQMRAEAERQRLLEQERAARAEAEQGRRRAALLAEASQAFAEATPAVQHVLDALGRRLAEALGDACEINLLSDDGKSLRSVALYDREPDRLTHELLASRPLRIGEGVAGHVAQTGEPLLLPSVCMDDLRRRLRTKQFELLEQLAPCSMMTAPLRMGGRVIGTLGVIRRAPSVPFTDDDLDLLRELADRVALAVENARLYQALAQRERQLQDLVGRLILAQEEERRRVAYNVHDGVAQVVAGTHLQLRAFARRYRPRRAAARQELERAVELAQRAVREARTVVAELRPTALDDLGLEAAVRAEVEELQKEGWQVEYQADLGPNRLDPAVETALFRVAQEALTNARKHARVPRARVALRRRGRRVRLEVRDWGRGFDPNVAPSGGGPGERVGLSGMRERCALLGGRCDVRSRPGAGTRIVAEVPLRAPVQESAAASPLRSGAEGKDDE